MKKIAAAASIALYLGVSPFAVMAADYGTVYAHDPLNGNKLTAYPAALPPVTVESFEAIWNTLPHVQFITRGELASGGIQVVVYDCSKPEYLNADAGLFYYYGKVSQLIRACAHPS